MLQHNDAPVVRRRLSSLIDSDALDDLIAQISEPVAVDKRFEAKTVDDWDMEYVIQRNYDTIKLSEGGDSLPVFVCGDFYVLIGDTLADRLHQRVPQGLRRRQELSCRSGAGGDRKGDGREGVGYFQRR